jgi:hypothetical protein
MRGLCIGGCPQNGQANKAGGGNGSVFICLRLRRSGNTPYTMKTALELAEEWLPKIERVLRKTLAKAILSLWTVATPFLLWWSPTSIPYKIAGSALWVLLTLCLWLLAWVLIYQSKIRMLEGASREKPSPESQLDPDDLRILEIASITGISGRDVGFSLRRLYGCKLVNPPPKTIKLHAGGINMNGCHISDSGISYIRQLKSTKPEQKGCR